MMNKILFYSVILSLLIAQQATPGHAQLARRVNEDSTAYQGLVRKNLTLRKDVKDLEKKYANLENERKILILHVKDLQTRRNSIEAMIQDLMGKIASLRI